MIYHAQKLHWPFSNLAECLPTDSDECLENTPKWGPGKDCAYAKKYCDSWAKDARRCCPETCKTGALTEDQCKALNSQGTCIYPLKNQCTSRGISDNLILKLMII